MIKYYRFTRRKIRTTKFKDLLFSKNEKPIKKAFAVAIGVFIGVIPIWGIQAPSAVVSAQFLKLNKPLAVLGSYINMTPLFPLIVLFSLKIGFAISGNFDSVPALSEITLATAKTYFWMYLLGCLPVAIITALIFGAITYITSHVLVVPEKKVIVNNPIQKIIQAA